MSWLLLSLAAPVLWAISTHFDKFLVDRYFKASDVGALLIFTAGVDTVLVFAIWLFDHSVVRADARSVALLMGAGALYMGAMLFYLRALQREDASLVAVFFQASPIFGFVLAYAFLGERLSLPQICGGLLMLCGVVTASVHPGREVPHRIKSRFVVLMLACSLAIAMSGLLFKFVAIHDAFWPSAFWFYAGEVAVGAGLLATAKNRRQFLSLVGSNPTFVISINALNEIINLIGSLAIRYALTVAPLSLVQAVSGTTVLFVFLIGVFLSAFFPQIEYEATGKWELVQKGIAALLVAAGLALAGNA